MAKRSTSALYEDFNKFVESQKKNTKTVDSKLIDDFKKFRQSTSSTREAQQYVQQQQKAEDRLQKSREKSIQDSLSNIKKYNNNNFLDQVQRASDAYDKLFGKKQYTSAGDYATFRNQYGNVLDNVDKYINEVNYLTRVGEIDRTQRNDYLKSLPNVKGTRLLNDAGENTVKYSQYKDRNAYNNKLEEDRIRNLDQPATQNKYNDTKQLIENLKKRASDMDVLSEQYDNTWRQIRQLEEENDKRYKDLNAWSQFKKQDELQQRQSEEYERIKNLDLAELEKKREALYKRSNIYQQIRDSSTYDNQSQYDAITNSIRQNQTEIDALERDITAKRNYDKANQYSAITDTLGEAENFNETYARQNNLYAAINASVYEGNGTGIRNIQEAINTVTDDERRTYNRIVAESGFDAGAEYIDFLRPTLNARLQQNVQEGLADYSEKHAIGGVLANVMASYAKPTGALYTLVHNIENGFKGISNYRAAVSGSGNYQDIRELDINSPWFAGSMVTEATTEGLTRNQDAISKYLTQTGLSILQNVSQMGLGEPATLAIMGLGSMADTARDIKRNGGSDSQALIGGTLAGITEVLFEKVSLDSVIKMAQTGNFDDLLKNLAKQGFIEGSEEIFTEATNIVTDYLVNGGSSDLMDIYNNYRRLGYSEREAEQFTFKDLATQVGMAGLGGALSGAVMGPGATVAGYANDVYTTNWIGKEIIKGDNNNLISVNDLFVRASEISPEVSNAFTDKDLKNAFKIGTLYRDVLSVEDGTLTKYEFGQKYGARSQKNIKEGKAGRITGKFDMTKSFADKVNDKDTTVYFDHISDDDTVYVRTDDNRVIKSDSLSEFKNRQLFENAADFGKEGAKAFVNNYDGNLSVTEYKTAFQIVVGQAYEGTLEQDAIQAGIDAGLTETQARSAFYVGQNKANAYKAGYISNFRNYANTIETEQIKEQLKEVIKGNNAKLGKVDTTNIVKKYQKVFDNEHVKVSSDIDFSTVDETRQESLAAAVTFIRALGRDVNILTQEEMSKKDPDTKKVLFTANAYFRGDENAYYLCIEQMNDAFMNIAMHETVHDIRQNAPKEYAKLKETVLKHLEGSDTFNLDLMHEFELLDKNKVGWENASEQLKETAYEELVANTVTAILNDPSTLQDFADKFITDEETREIFVGFLDKLLHTFRAAFDKVKKRLGWRQIQKIENNLTALEEIRDAYFSGLEGIRGTVPANNSLKQYSINLEDVHNLRTLDRKSVSELTEEDAEKLEKWIHLYNDQLGRKSPFYRAEHGDWRLNDKDIVSVVELDDKENKIVKGNQDNMDTGWKIRISKNGLTNTRYHSRSGGKSIGYITAINPLIKNGVLLDTETHESHKQNPLDDYVSLDNKFYSIGHASDGTYSLLKMTVQDFYQGKEGSTQVFHNLKYVSEIESIEIKKDDILRRLNTPDNEVAQSASPEDNHPIFTVSDVYRLVKKYDKEFLGKYKADTSEAPDMRKNSVNLDTLGNQLTEEQDNYFADSKIRDNNGNLKVMYHGTNADFNIFDQLNFGEVGDTAEGFGIYLTDTREVADSYGGRIIEAYANVTRPASKNAKTIKRAELARLIKATCENEAKSFMEDGYDSVEDALKDTWVSNYTYTYDKPMNAVYNQVAADILRMNDNDMDIVQEVMSGMAIRDYAKAYEFYPLLTETMGIDGFETTWEDSTNPENPAHIVVAFNSEQVKNIDNKTPTSNPDIRYSPNQDAINDSFIPVEDRQFTYEEFANKPDMQVVAVENETEGLSRTEIVNQSINNAKTIGKATSKGAAIVHVTDTDKDVIISSGGLRHGLTIKTKNRYRNNAIVSAKYGKVLQNSFLLNVLDNSVRDSYQTKDTDVYIGIAKEGDTLYIVRSLVNNKTNDLEEYSVLYAVDTKKESAAQSVPAEGDKLLSSNTDSTIKIADVLRLVNKYFPDILPEDIYRHFGHEVRPEGVLGKSARYSVDLSSLDNSGEQNVENLKNTLGTQYKLNIAKKLTPEVADKIAGRILKDVHSTFDRAELATGLTQIINEAARQGKDLDVDTFLDKGTALIRDVLEKSTEFNQEAYDEDQKVRDYLTSTKIKLTTTQQQEVTHMFDSVRAYRASLFGSPVKISSSTGQSLDVVWNELSALNPVLFPADASEGDMPVYLADAAQLLKKSNYYFNPYGFDADGMAAIMFADTIADYTENKRIKTVVNQMKSYGKHYFEDTMKELNRRTRERAASQKAHTEKLKNDLTLLRAETSKWKQTYDELIINDDLDIRQAEYELRQLPAGTDRFDYEQAIKGLKAEKQRHEYALREYMKMQTEKAQELQKEIEESAKEYIRAGGKGINYAMDARQAVIRTRSLAQQKQLKEQAQRRAVINTVRKNASNLLGRLLTSSDTRHVPENLRVPVANFLQNLDLGFTGEETNAAISWIENLGRLSDKMKNFNQASGTFQVDDMIIEQLDQIATDLRTRLNISGKNLNDMTLYELQQLRDTVSLINAAIYNSDRLLADDRKQRASALAERSMNEMAGKKQRKFTKGIMKLAGDFFAIDQLDSFSFAERMGKDFNDTIFKNLRKGFDKKVEYVKQGNDAFARALSKLSADQKTAKRLLQSMSGSKAEATRFNLESGRSITLTPAQVMELYLLNNREDARRHIYNGGLTVMEYGSGKNNVKKQEMIQITESDIKAITDSLTTQQKSFAESLQQFAAHSVSEWGNNVSMTLWGIKKFTDPDYWRINVDSNTLNAVAADKKTGEVGMYHLKNIGVSKQTNEFATNPLIIGDIVDSFVQHVDEMSSYGAYTVPLDDAMKWYNYKNGNRTVQRSIENYMGVAGKQYFVDFIKALNSAQDRAGGMPILDRLISNAKVAAIAANLRVVVQQPSAYARAMDVIDPKYLVQTGNPLAGAKEAQEHSSIAAWKNWGFRDADIGQSLREVMVGDGGTIKAAGRADDVTWGAIWNAVKAEVKDKNPGLRVGSAEYWNAVSERFTEVIDKTQVVDSPFHRSKGMRSKNMLWKMATAFMSEPTKSYNMFYRTVSDAYQNGVNARTAKRFTRALVSFVTATALNSMLASIIDVIRHRDDDEDKDFWERYFNEVGQNIIDGLNPLNLIPIGKDIMSMIQGYDPSRLDLDALNRLIQTGKQAISAITGDSKDRKWERIFYDLVGEASKITGIPAGNFLRTVDNVTNLISKAFGKDIELFGKYKEWSTSKKTAGNMYTEYKKTGKWTEDLLEKYVSMKTDEVIKEEEQRELEGHNRKYATTEDVTRYATNQVYGNFASMLAEDDERIAEAYEAKVSGNSATVTRIKKAFTDAGIPGEIFDKAVLVYGNNLEESDPKSIRDFNAKLYDYDDLATAIMNGYDTDDMYNEIVSDSTAKNPEENTVSETMERLQKYYQMYILEGNTGKAEEIKKNTQEAFELDDSRFTNWNNSVEKMQFQNEVPEAYEITITGINDYNEYCKNAGISKEVFYQAFVFEKNTGGEIDSNGKSIPFSKCVKIMDYINNLPLTPEQKTALASCWYKGSTLEKYKLW